MASGVLPPGANKENEMPSSAPAGVLPVDLATAGRTKPLTGTEKRALLREIKASATEAAKQNEEELKKLPKPKGSRLAETAEERMLVHAATFMVNEKIEHANKVKRALEMLGLPEKLRNLFDGMRAYEQAILIAMVQRHMGVNTCPTKQQLEAETDPKEEEGM